MSRLPILTLAVVGGCAVGLQPERLEGRALRGVEAPVAWFVEAVDRDLTAGRRRVKVCDWNPTSATFGVAFGTYDPQTTVITLDGGAVFDVEATPNADIAIGGTDFDETLDWSAAISSAPAGVCGPVCPESGAEPSFDDPTATTLGACTGFCGASGIPWGVCMYVPAFSGVSRFATCECAEEVRTFPY